MSLLSSPEKLQRHHRRTEFSCGHSELDEWLRRYAWQNQRNHNAVTYVCCVQGEVVGYYALCTGAVAAKNVSVEFGRGRPHPIPCIILARLAVDQRLHGRGVGKALLRDALERCVFVADSIGAACVLVNCVDEQAKDFYLSLGIFHESPVDELQLIVPIKGLMQAFLALKPMP